MLRDLCATFLRNGEDVIAIAPTIFDRFKRLPKKRFRFFGARQGQSAARTVIKTALAKASIEGEQIIKNITQALKYTNFDPEIGIRISKINPGEINFGFDFLTGNETDQVISALRRLKHGNYPDGIARISLDSYSFSELSSVGLAVLAGYEKILQEKKVISRIEYFFFREGRPIPLLEACSGELNFITAIAFIATHIKPHSVIAIDEPDTSLHPTWQQSYISTLLALFYKYQPRILIATHSPIIVSGAEQSGSNLTVYEMEEGLTKIFNHLDMSLEAMYDRLFGLITPKNHYLSQRAITLLNELNDQKRSLGDVTEELQELRHKSYDHSQQEVILRIEAMARELVSTKGDSTND